MRKARIGVAYWWSDISEYFGEERLVLTSVSTQPNAGFSHSSLNTRLNLPQFKLVPIIYSFTALVSIGTRCAGTAPRSTSR